MTLLTKRNASKTTGLRQALLLINIVGKAWRANVGSPPNLNSLHFRLLRKGEGVILGRRLRSALFLLYHCLLCWRAKAMQTIYVSNHGDDKNYGLTQEAAVRSWKRYMTLSRGNHELHLMEGDVTFQRLVRPMREGGT